VKIEAVNIWSFSLRLDRNLKLAGQIYDRREGLLVELIDTKGQVGWGEISPLPGFSRETFEDALSHLKSARQRIIGRDLPILSENSFCTHGISTLSGFLSDSSLAPSVGFGLNTAWLTCMANERCKRLAEMLHPNPMKSISVNALLTGSAEEVNARVYESLRQGYQSFKLKIGRQALDDDIVKVRAVRKQIGDSCLRLDCNRSWTVEDALSFWKEIHDCEIEYIEEPLKEFNDYKVLALSQNEGHELPLALDESLMSMSPQEVLSVPNLRALIIKPTILGFVMTAKYAMLARENSIKPVISSSFESSVGLSALAQMAAAFNETDVPAGLGTLGWMADDLLADPMKIENGKISIAELPDIDDSIRRNVIKLESLDDY